MSRRLAAVIQATAPALLAALLLAATAAPHTPPAHQQRPYRPATDDERLQRQQEQLLEDMDRLMRHLPAPTATNGAT